MQLTLPFFKPLLPCQIQGNLETRTSDIVAVAIIAILCSANDWVSAVNWANAYKEWFQSVGLCFNGISSHDTIGSFFRLVDPKAFETCFVEWMQTLVEKIEGVIAIDGKTICNSSDEFNGKKSTHIVTAFTAENDIILGQLRTPEKSNEITAIPELLKILKLKGKITVERRYYISSLALSAGRIGEIIRLHWGIENKLHWHLDITFNEDKAKIRAGHGAENFSLLKRCVLNLVKADTDRKLSIRIKRMKAGWDPAYRLKLLGVK